MFFGEYEHKLDAKGRLMVPAKFRDDLSECFYLTKGMEGCLFLFAEDEWNKIGEKINAMSQFGRSKARAFARVFYAGAAELSLDKQGRILIPANLRTYASIEREAYVIGVAKRIEIWSKDKWETYSDEEFLNYESLTDELMDLDI